jgi:hypothetical protein
MLEFAIANLVVGEQSFEIPSKLGKWEFTRTNNYQQIVTSLEKGMCGNTFFASIDTVNHKSADLDFQTACDEIIDICLTLSFLTARCVTPSGTTGSSEIQFVQLGDDFVPSRAIVGLPELYPSSLSSFFLDWVSTIHPAIVQRRLRLHLCHWLSGLTCFTLEDVYLSAGVQMDIVKQLERRITGNLNLTFFQGMTSASTRYSLTALGNDYKAMRNDIVHEGVLSGSNFPNKTKGQCAIVIAETLNWLDSYILAVMGKTSQRLGFPRWKGVDFEHGLPSLSVR